MYIVIKKILDGENIRKVLEDTESAPKDFAEYVRANWPGRSLKMEQFNLDGVGNIKTNFGASEYPMLRGFENGYSKIDHYGKSVDEAFNKLLSLGFTYIRFARMATAVRGFNNVFVLAKK